MNDKEDVGLVKIRRALISVSDKSGIVEFACDLKSHDVEIISTGGTAKTLRDAGLDVRDVSEVTGFPEMMDGRVKTLHPGIHGALLAVRNNPEHTAAMVENGIQPIDMVVVNLYPFEQTVAREGTTLAEAVEQIDIGGPAMIRSAAKNWESVTVVTSPETYSHILQELEEQQGSLLLGTRAQLAQAAFLHTSLYDARVFAYLASQIPGIGSDSWNPSLEPAAIVAAMETFALLTSQFIEQMPAGDDQGEDFEDNTFPTFPDISLSKLGQLRYGENPHQAAALYEIPTVAAGLAHAELLSGKDMSFNNYVDADAAWQLVCDFAQTACAIIKHTNPAGVGLGSTPEVAYRKALATDPVSAFGGIVAFNCCVDESAARAVIEIFTEVVIAPDYNEQALAVFRSRKNLRVLRAAAPATAEGLEYKQIGGGMLVQTRDTHVLARANLKTVSNREPTADEIEALLFAWTVCKHTKSNAIVYARADQTVGVGAGQMSRVDSVKLGAMRAQLPLAGSVLASDAFFPFRDGIDQAATHGITAVIQPGGSLRDAETIAAADEHGLAMVFTGIRHFKH